MSYLGVMSSLSELGIINYTAISIRILNNYSTDIFIGQIEVFFLSDDYFQAFAIRSQCSKEQKENGAAGGAKRFISLILENTIKLQGRVVQSWVSLGPHYREASYPAKRVEKRIRSKA
jgi:hypothetical protein